MSNLVLTLTFDHIGQTHFNKQLTLLKYGGTLVSCGATTGYDAQIDLRHIFFKGINVLAQLKEQKQRWNKDYTGWDKEKSKQQLIQPYSFEQAAEAHTKMLQGKFFGKILMKPEGA